MGHLSATQYVRHMVTCTKLTGWQSPDFKKKQLIVPDKFSPEATHDFIAIYQKVTVWDKTIILFRFQIRNNDKTALQLFELIVEAMTNTQAVNSRYLLNSKYDYLWQEIAQIKLKSISSEQTTIFLEQSEL